ncbi:L-lysine 6-transaminase [Streptomyces zaomyceticus]|uniref:L-lysine 6-transaminase n=1 Tax=Streptomyces zaomyceticus TaxID=68286 RepID=UPI00167972C6|nr:L-lysine 6-transaminase [Streptomyces zaomyceticus]GHF99686.1 putative L-lysine-epsilon aminotransferase [Streptomyces zaomyceticus]
MEITADNALEELSRHVLMDGLDLVLDLERSRGSTLVDARGGEEYLDLLTFYGSLPLGMNHPGMADDPEFLAELTRAALHKVTNSDIYTVQYARFTEAFRRVLGDPRLPHLFFIDGGALAVENALKVAFDWRAQRRGPDPAPLEVLHMEGAFHGRSGYTLSLTNTSPTVTARYPAWTWPRVPVPGPGGEREAVEAARRHLAERGDRIACFIAEPVQGAGGDRHLGREFLLRMQDLCHRYDVLFVLDEVQTGCGLSGAPWTYQRLGLEPDVVAFGKKTQVCGLMAGGRVDEVPEGALAVPDRLGSTWGGNTADMVRATRILEIIERDGLMDAAETKGRHLGRLLDELAAAHPALVSDVRGLGLMWAFDLPDTALRNEVLGRLRRSHRVLLLPGGPRAVRFRPALTVGLDDLDKGVAAVDAVLTSMSVR